MAKPHPLCPSRRTERGFSSLLPPNGLGSGADKGDAAAERAGLLAGLRELLAEKGRYSQRHHQPWLDDQIFQTRRKLERLRASR